MALSAKFPIILTALSSNSSWLAHKSHSFTFTDIDFLSEIPKLSLIGLEYNANLSERKKLIQKINKI